MPDAPGSCGVHVDAVNGPLQPIAGAPAPPLDVPFRALVENVIEGIALIALDGVLLYGNPRLAQILGRRVDELTGLNLLKCLDPPWRQVARDALARRRGGLADGYDLDVRPSDGDLRHLHVRGAPLRDANGQVSGSVALIHDDTEHHDAELQALLLFPWVGGDPLRG